MGTRTVYIRKEYEELFDSLDNKSEFLAWALALLKAKRAKEQDAPSAED